MYTVINKKHFDKKQNLGRDVAGSFGIYNSWKQSHILFILFNFQSRYTQVENQAYSFSACCKKTLTNYFDCKIFSSFWVLQNSG